MVGDPRFTHQWLMGAGLLCLLLGLACVDVVFICLLMGKGSALTLIVTQGAAAALVFMGLVLLRVGGKHKPEPLSSSTPLAK